VDAYEVEDKDLLDKGLISTFSLICTCEYKLKQEIRNPANTRTTFLINIPIMLIVKNDRQGTNLYIHE
jgi:hypothetical protein